MSNGVCYVYWIHLPYHTDVFTQGYVGFTGNNVQHRFKQHLKAMRPNKKTGVCIVLNRALHKYGPDNVVVDTLCVCDKEYGLWLEQKLRPSPNIGWNVATGGVACGLGISPSVETRKKISDAGKGRKHTDEAKQKISESKKGIPRPEHVIEILSKCSENNWLWNNARANKQIWSEAERIYEEWNIDRCGSWALTTRLGDRFKWSSLMGMHRNFKSGWNPSEDLEYLAWREAYLAEQRKDSNDT